MGRGTASNIHLRCFTHVEYDIKAKLQSTPQSSGKFVLKFWAKKKMGEGLVDCESESEDAFQASLSLMRQQWPAEFPEWLFSTRGRVRPLTETLKICMMKPVRVAAGLGNPPNKWHNQATEALHHVLKDEADGESLDQATIHENVNSRVVTLQKNEFVKALYGMGDYRLAPQYANLGVDPVRWSQMTYAQRSAYTKKVLGEGLVADASADDVSSKKLSISIEESGLSGQLAAQVLADIWGGADVILTRYKVIPSDNGNFCVTESSKAVKEEGSCIAANAILQQQQEEPASTPLLWQKFKAP